LQFRAAHPPAQTPRGRPAYAAWTGIGAAGTVLVGMIWLGETASVIKLVSIALVLAGIVGLQLTDPH
jgi:quaternary ammonium compound-resistance protein SugE